MNLSRMESLGATRQFEKDLCDALSQSPMFSDFLWKELETLSHYMSGYRAMAGSLLFEEGDPGDALGILISGHIQVCKEDEDGKNQIVAEIPGGRTFGEMSVIDGERRSATCIAIKESQLAILPKQQFERLLHDHPGLGSRLLLKIAKLMSQRLRQASGLLVDYLSRDH